MDAVFPGSPKPDPRLARSPIPSPSLMRRLSYSWLIGIACLLASGCATQGGALDKTLQAVGLKKQGAAQSNQLPVRLYAGDNLNAGGDGQPAVLAVRVYQLRAAKRFDDAAFDVFLDERREQDTLGDDLISVTEFLLAPGKRHEVEESLPADGTHLGVVALFRTPAPTRWRFTFDTAKAAAEGITVGLHSCAMTTSTPALTTRLSTPAHSLSSSRCASAGR